MPIYAYRCTACGHAKDVLQKVSDPVLTVCPACGASAFQKQVTAAGFQLKGSGWYVTDFRDGGSATNKAANGGNGDANKTDGAAKADGGDKSGASAGSGTGDASGTPAPAPAPAASAPSSAPATDAN